MFTKRTFSAPSDAEPSGNLEQQVLQLRAQLKDTRKWVLSIIQQLNQPGSITISQGKIDDTNIGADKAGTGAFTTLTASGLVDLSGSGAGQIKFPATQNASSDANTLDDYEEGTWTPTLTFATAGDLSVTYSIRQGSYTKIGRLVVLTFNIVTSAFTFTTASGACELTGLPFTASSDSNYVDFGALSWQGITKTNYTHAVAQVASGHAFVDFLISGSGQSLAQVSASDMPTGGTVRLRGTVSYRV